MKDLKDVYKDIGSYRKKLGPGEVRKRVSAWNSYEINLDRLERLCKENKQNSYNVTRDDIEERLY